MSTTTTWFDIDFNRQHT